MSSGHERANRWISGLKKGMTKQEVEDSRPEHVTIYWDHPIEGDSGRMEYDVRYADRTEFLSVPFYLVFRDGRFEGYSGRN
ncbi:MAG TPA: hypothetical protein VGE21_10070 [Flavobacteriales bacterium]